MSGGEWTRVAYPSHNQLSTGPDSPLKQHLSPPHTHTHEPTHSRRARERDLRPRVNPPHPTTHQRLHKKMTSQISEGLVGVLSLSVSVCLRVHLSL